MVKIIIHVKIACLSVLSSFSKGYKIPNKPYLAGLAVSGSAGISYKPITRIATIIGGVYL